MLKFLIIFISSLSFLYQVLSTGHIHQWDYTVDFTNTGYTKSFSFGFSLDNGLSSSDYIKIKFPFALHTSPTISNDFSIVLKLVGQSGCTSIQTTSTNVFLGTETNTYHIQFLDEKGNINKALVASTWYILKFELANALSVAKGNYAPVQIFTVSSTTTNALIYDYNRVFANIEVSDAPSLGTLQFSSTISSSNKNDIDSIYEVVFDVSPSINITNQSRIYILMQNNAWNFNGDSCISIDSSISQTLDNGTKIVYLNPALTSLEFSCQIDSINNRVMISLNTSILSEKHYVFSVSVRNPKYVAQNGGFEIRSLLSNANKIIEKTVGSLTFSVNPLNWGTTNSNLKVMLGWGVDISKSSLPPQFTFFRGSAALNPFKFYNAIQFIFTPSYETGTGVQLKIELRLDAESGFEILAGSISENLPSFGNNQVYCSLDSTITLNKITCYNVGVLSNLSDYHIGLKAYFPYDATESVLNANFGNLAIYTYHSSLGNYDSLPLIGEGRCQLISYATKNNLPGILPSVASNCYTMAHSQTGTNIVAVNPSNCGIKTNEKAQNLAFTFTATAAQIYGATFNTYAGFSIYSTRFIHESPTYSATDPIIDENSITPESTSVADVLNARAGHDYSRGKKWTWFKIYALNDVNLNAFKGTAGNVFGVKNIMITSRSGNYAEENCFDFYIASYNNIEGTTPVLINVFAFNSYSISDSYIGLGDNTGVIKLAIVNFWTGLAAGGSNTGEHFPIFIRILGYLDKGYMTNVKRLAIFFDNLNYFTSSTYNSVDVVDCASSMSSKTTCYGYKGQATHPLLLNSIHSLNRIEIDVEGILAGTSQASPFQILIPMKSIENIGSISLQFATLTTDYYYGIYKSYTTILNTFNTFYQTTFIPKLYASIINTAVLTGIDYKLSFSTNPGVGKTSNPIKAVIKCGHNDANPSSPLVNFNSDPNYGAGFTYISDYNMIGSGFFASGTLINTQITSKCCIPFSYTYSTTKKYGFFCPFSLNSISTASSLSALNFLFPYQNGQRIIDNTYALWSDKTGNLISYQWHDNTGGLELFIQGAVTLIDGGVKPPLVKGAANQQLQWTFKTENPIPINGKVKVTFTTSTWSFSLDTTEKCILKANLLANDRKHNCMISQTTNSYIMFSFSASTSDLSFFPAGQYTLIQYGIDKDSADGIYSDFTLAIYTINNFLIDKSSNLAGTLKFINSASQVKLVVSNSVVQTLTEGFRDNFNFQFSVLNKPIYFNENLYIKLGALALKSISSQVICTINEGSMSSFDWRSIDITDLNNIILIPKADITTLNKLYSVICEGIYIPNTNVPGLSMILYHLLTVVQTSNTISYPDFTSPYMGSLITPNLTLYKNTNAKGQEIEFTFGVLLDAILNSTSSIILNLPIQYNSKGFCSCWINTIQVFCYYPRVHSIIIEGIDISIAANTSFNVTIMGLLNPEISSLNSQTTFLIGFNQSNDPSLLTYFGEIFDVINQATTIENLGVAKASSSNNYILEQTVYKIYFDSFPIDLSTDQFLVFDLVDYESYGNIMQRSKSLSCSIVNQETKASLMKSCVMKGLRIKFTINGIIPQNSLQILTIFNLPNPEYINCNIRKPSISIIDSDYVTVLYRTNAINANIPNCYVKKNTTLQYTYWKDSNGNIIKHNQNVFEITIGMLSNIISLVPHFRPFFKLMGLNTTPKASNWPTLTQGNGIKIGDFSYSFRIGCPSKMSEQVLEYLIYKIEPENPTYYSNLEQLSISLVYKKFAIQPDRFTYSIANLGRSLPIIFDFTEKCPYDYLLIKFAITFSVADLGFIFQETKNITQIFNVTVQTPIVKLQILSTQNFTIDSGSFGQISFTLLGGNVDSYTFSPSPIILQAQYGFPNIIPYISIIYEGYSKKATQHQVTVEVSETCTVYCHVALVLSDSFTRDFNYTRTMADKSSEINARDRYQEQFIAWYIEDWTFIQTFSITELRAKKSYDFICWAMNLLGNVSLPFNGKFTTADNGGKLMRLGMSFYGELTISQKQQVSCYLCTYFAIPCQNVQSYDNYYCPYTNYKELIKTTTNTNSTAIIATNATNATINTTNINTTNITTNTSSNSSSNSNSNTSSNATQNSSSNKSNITIPIISLNFYFLPLDDVETDSSYSDITEATQQNFFKSYLIGNLTTLPNITAVNPISEVSEIDPEIDTSMSLNTTIGGTWVYFTGFRMKSRGFILMSIELDIDLRNNTSNISNSSNSSNSTNETNNTSNTTNNLTSSTNDTSTNNTNSSVDINIFGSRRFLVINTTNSTLNDSLNATNITVDNLTLFRPSPAQIKLKIDVYNQSILLSHVVFYNYTDASINVTELNFSTSYRIYYTFSSENPAVYCMLSNEVRSLNLTTKDKFEVSKYSQKYIFEKYVLIICIIFFW